MGSGENEKKKKKLTKKGHFVFERTAVVVWLEITAEVDDITLGYHLSVIL